MPGQSANSGASRRRAGSRVASVVALLLALSMVAAFGVTVPDGRLARASVLAVDAADYVPTLSNLPPGYREEAVDAVGGDLQPTISLRRAFVSLDGSRRAVVDVSLGSSVTDAHTMLGDRMNQLIRYHGWRITPNAPFGESGFRGTGPTPEGASSAMIAFRIRAVTAEVNVTSTAATSTSHSWTTWRASSSTASTPIRKPWPTSPVGPKSQRSYPAVIPWSSAPSRSVRAGSCRPGPR